jgi:hypothetical protein
MWLYENVEVKSLDDIPNGSFGFIYITTHTPTNKKYLGKKSLFHNVKKKLTQKQLLEQTGRGRRSTTEVIQKESDWKSYYGSEEYIKSLIKENKQEEFTREIIHFVGNKKLLTYFECKYQFTYNVLESKDWLNSNILGKFYKKDLDS